MQHLKQTHNTLALTGLAGLVAGAISMTAGEYISVSSQADTEQADIDKESQGLMQKPDEELDELTQIYEERGLPTELAYHVAVALTEHDALNNHIRDEIGLGEHGATPLQACFASGLSFCLGALMPVLIAILVPLSYLIPSLAVSTLIGLIVLGVVSATLGGAPRLPAVKRILVWGSLALTMTFIIRRLFDI